MIRNAYGGIEFDDADRSTIRRLYLDERQTAREVGLHFGIGVTRMAAELRSLKLTKDRKRQKFDVAIRGGGQGNGIDLEFLRAWSHASAWVWGLWFGDGWLDVHNMFGFSGDLDVLLRVKALLRTKAEPYQGATIKSARQGWRLVVCSRAVAEIVRERFGLLPGKKSNRLQWPDVPQEFACDFARGLWDADGCWSHVTVKGRRYLQACFGSTSQALVSALACQITQCAGATPKEPQRAKRQKTKKSHLDLWIVRYGREDGNRIASWMYDSSEVQNRSDRKYLKWLSYQ